MTIGDTIVALSSVSSPSLRSVVRCSGPESLSIAQAMCRGLDISRPVATRSRLTIAGLDLPIWVYLFHAPKSYTGESIAEFHLPGNPLVVKRVIAECLQRGARSAEPGEFTARAYFNSRLNLTEAEGVAATIAARSDEELHAARKLLAGELTKRLQSPIDALAQTLALIEVGIDFSDEDVTFLSSDDAAARIDNLLQELNDLIANSARFEDLAHEPTAVLVGYPNAGKSTLLNALAGYDRAVVSDVAGTTRDALSAHVPLHRGLIRLIDVAGLDATDETSDSQRSASPADGSDAQSHIDRQMQDRAVRTIEQADLIVLVHAIDDPRPPASLQKRADLVIRSKCDLLPAGNVVQNREGTTAANSASVAPVASDELPVSAANGTGLDLLRTRLDDLAYGNHGNSTLALNARHLADLNDCTNALTRARSSLKAGPEIVAMHLRDALDALGKVAGGVSPDDVLGRVFSAFCIGK